MTGGTNRPFSAQGHSVYALLRLHFDDELTQRYVTLHTKLYIKIIYTTAREPQVLTLALGRVEKHHASIIIIMIIIIIINAIYP